VHKSALFILDNPDQLCYLIREQLNNMTHPEGRRERPDEAPATRAWIDHPRFKGANSDSVCLRDERLAKQ
jgi:hypothetical protein